MMPTVYLKLLVGIVALVLAAQAHATLTIVLDIPKTTILVGEPVVLRLIVSNTGSEDATIPSDFSPHYGTVYFVSALGGVFQEIHGWGRFDANAPAMTLTAGASYSFEITLSSTWRDGQIASLFPESGEYTLHVAVGGGQLDRDNIYGLWSRESLTTNDVVVNVLAPATPEEVRIADLMLAPETLGVMRYLSMGSDDALSAVIEDIYRSQTPYAPFAALVLARHAMTLKQEPWPTMEYADVVGFERDKADSALAYLEKADFDGSPVRSEAVRLKLEAHRKKAALANNKRYLLPSGQRDLRMVQERYPDLWFSEVEVETLENRILTEFPDSVAANRLRKELDARR